MRPTPRLREHGGGGGTQQFFPGTSFFLKADQQLKEGDPNFSTVAGFCAIFSKQLVCNLPYGMYRQATPVSWKTKSWPPPPAYSTLQPRGATIEDKGGLQPGSVRAGCPDYHQSSNSLCIELVHGGSTGTSEKRTSVGKKKFRFS